MEDQGLVIEDHMQCPICLEPFLVPVTLPCGHSFCRDCISKYWECGEQDISCPVCKVTFDSRPLLNRNVSLSELAEAVAHSPARRDMCMERSDGGDLERLCERHRRHLLFYCRNHGLCICDECSVNECKSHERILLEEEEKNTQVRLQEKSTEISRQLEDTNTSQTQLMENLEKAKVSMQQTSLRVKSKFSQLLKELAEKQEVIERFLEQQQELTVSQAEERLKELQARETQLKVLQEKIRNLCLLSHCHVIKESRLLELPPLVDVCVEVNVSVQQNLDPITDLLSGISKLLSEDLQLSTGQETTVSPQDKRPVQAVVPSPVVLPLRVQNDEFHEYHRSLTFDPRTANHNLRLSLSDRRAEHLISGPHPVCPDESRFDHSWQVMCVQSFSSGQHYWEMEVSKPWALIGVSYPSIPRKERNRRSNVGMNEVSWSLQLDERRTSAWHAGHEEALAGRVPLRVGVLLDCDNGSLSFYGEGRVRLHAFHCTFTQPLLPVCWVGEDVTVTLCETRL